jgi:hypothetical protein
VFRGVVPRQRTTTRNFPPVAVWLYGCVTVSLALDAGPNIDSPTCLGGLIGFESWLTLCPRLPFYQDKLHEETVFRRFSEILAKVGGVVCASRFMTRDKWTRTADVCRPTRRPISRRRSSRSLKRYVGRVLPVFGSCVAIACMARSLDGGKRISGSAGHISVPVPACQRASVPACQRASEPASFVPLTVDCSFSGS